MPDMPDTVRSASSVVRTLTMPRRQVTRCSFSRLLSRSSGTKSPISRPAAPSSTCWRNKQPRDELKRVLQIVVILGVKCTFGQQSVEPRQRRSLRQPRPERQQPRRFHQGQAAAQLQIDHPRTVLLVALASEPPEPVERRAVVGLDRVQVPDEGRALGDRLHDVTAQRLRKRGIAPHVLEIDQDVAQQQLGLRAPSQPDGDLLDAIPRSACARPGWWP